MRSPTSRSGSTSIQSGLSCGGGATMAAPRRKPNSSSKTSSIGSLFSSSYDAVSEVCLLAALFKRKCRSDNGQQACHRQACTEIIRHLFLFGLSAFYNSNEHATE